MVSNKSNLIQSITNLFKFSSPIFARKQFFMHFKYEKERSAEQLATAREKNYSK